jgi:dephospho-CoA kinase
MERMGRKLRWSGYVAAMLLIGLTGGIGSGKSTVSDALAARGAEIVDADRITREVQAPGQPVLAAMVERFGAGILNADGELERQRVADIVFADAEALQDLNAIVHPAVGARMAERLAELAEGDDIVILDVPLLVESGRDDLAKTIVVDTDPEIAVARLIEHRGFSDADARARVARQASREDRRAKADFVIHNGGTRADLAPQIETCWSWLESLRAEP